METYHAVTPVAQPQPTTEDDIDRHALAPVEPPAPEPELSEAPAAVVNHTIEELAREGARRMLERSYWPPPRAIIDRRCATRKRASIFAANQVVC